MFNLKKVNFITANTYNALLALLLALTSCSKATTANNTATPIPDVETFPITAGKLTNCRFQNPSPTYTFQSTIAANPILCENGVPRKVELLTPTDLPTGMMFSMNQLSLTGVANQRVTGAPYQYYIENEAGYMIINLQVTVK